MTPAIFKIPYHLLQLHSPTYQYNPFSTVFLGVSLETVTQ